MESMEDDELLEDDEELELPYLLFSVKGRLFAVSTGQIQEMLVVPETTFIPDAPEYVRGVINIRGKVHQLVDLRLRLGMSSHYQEMKDLTDNLDKRKQEHEHWLEELESSVREERKFELELDPHKCKFGRWYDSFQSDDSMVQMELKKFDKPHKAIHSTAAEVLDLTGRGQKDEALHIIRARKEGELALMMELFENMKEILRDTQREIAIIVELANNSFALAVDRVEAVENIDLNAEKDVAGLLEGFGGHFHGEIARRKGSEELVLLVDPEWVGGEAV